MAVVFAGAFGIDDTWVANEICQTFETVVLLGVFGAEVFLVPLHAQNCCRLRTMVAASAF